MGEVANVERVAAATASCDFALMANPILFGKWARIDASDCLSPITDSISVLEAVIACFRIRF